MTRRHPIDDAAVEALVTGHKADDELAILAGFAQDARLLADGPVPVPSPRLAQMLAEGVSTEKGDLLVTAASNVTGPAPQAAGLPKWRKKKMLVAEFLAGLSVAAKAAFGMSAAAAAVTAGGAAGVLPGPAQGAVATAVEAVSPFSLPDESDGSNDFGVRVSTDARDGGVDGATISSEPRLNGQANRPADVPPADVPQDTGRPANPGQNGLDRANQTPAAGHVPTSVPAGRPTTAGSQASAGLAIANSTPAAGHVPTSVPAGPGGTPPAAAGSNASTGLDAAANTPAGGRVPGSVPRGDRP